MTPRSAQGSWGKAGASGRHPTCCTGPKQAAAQELCRFCLRSLAGGRHIGTSSCLLLQQGWGPASTTSTPAAAERGTPTPWLAPSSHKPHAHRARLLRDWSRTAPLQSHRAAASSATARARNTFCYRVTAQAPLGQSPPGAHGLTLVRLT